MNKQKQHPWAIRRAEAVRGGGRSSRTERAIGSLLLEPVPTVLLGAALVSGQPCLLWNAQTVLEEAMDGKTDWRRASGWTLMSKIVNKIASDSIEQEAAGWAFRFLVEPFALMNQSTTVYPISGRPSTTCE